MTGEKNIKNTIIAITTEKTAKINLKLFLNFFIIHVSFLETANC
jgi:hypothetical protein